ncbi:MAG: YbhB/YbcL family Raf kinase inhibitor-like protein [Brevinematia bacterium]
MSIKLKSPSFKNGDMMPSKYAYDRENLSPPLEWENIPSNAKSIAIICDDPDAPVGNWVHWIIFNIPATKKGLAENISKNPELPDGSRQGRNDYGKIGYDGPCPPYGTHRYVFKIFALDTMLDLKAGCSRGEIINAMKNHILDKGELTGLYSRK